MHHKFCGMQIASRIYSKLICPCLCDWQDFFNVQIINIYNWVDIGSPLFPTASIGVRKAERQTQPCKILEHNMACRWHRAAINKPGFWVLPLFFQELMSVAISVLSCQCWRALSSADWAAFHRFRWKSTWAFLHSIKGGDRGGEQKLWIWTLNHSQEYYGTLSLGTLANGLTLLHKHDCI